MAINPNMDFLCGKSLRATRFGCEPPRRPDLNIAAPRDVKKTIGRSREAKREFERQHPCPSTGETSGGCPGYVVDHRTALAAGGVDEPSNMEWQTTADARAKDKWERKS